MLCIPASSDVLMTSHGPPHLHLLHPALPSPFSSHLIKKKRQKLWFGTFVMESEWILPNAGLLVSVSRCTGLVSMVAFLLPVNALLAGMQLGLRPDKSVDTFHTLVPCPLMTMNHFLKNNVTFWNWVHLQLLPCSQIVEPIRRPWSSEAMIIWAGLAGDSLVCGSVRVLQHISSFYCDGSATSDHLHLCLPSIWDSFTTGGSKDPLDLMYRNTTLKEHLQTYSRLSDFILMLYIYIFIFTTVNI